MEKVVFTIDGNTDAYVGYTKGGIWNGWACPFFTMDEALRIMNTYNKYNDNHIYYDETTDSFRIDEEGCASEIYKGKDYSTAEGIKHLYPIGNCCWIWNQEFTTPTARAIEDFLWEFDTYEYWDNLKIEDDVAEEIEKQLQDVDVFKEVVIIFQNEELSAEEKFTRLGGILKL